MIDLNLYHRQVQQLSTSFNHDSTEANVVLSHRLLCLTEEVGELIKLLNLHLIHGQPLDFESIEDEAGDVIWNLADLMDLVGSDLPRIIEHNFNKQRQRFPSVVGDVS